MSSSSDDTILPAPRRPINSGGLDGVTVLPSQNAPGIHAHGDVIDSRYTVIREIGRGGMGVVYEVEDAVTSDRYAVKRLLPEYSSRSEIVEVFRSEGAASMRFTNKSPRFVTTQTVNLENDVPYIVLQLVNQPTLRTILQSTTGGRLLLPEVLPILREVAVALSELHDLGYVHRDLKPENIFVDYSDGNPTVMLVDFGLTKDIDYATRTVMRGAGTERYASPEQLKGMPTTPTTDVYAFGVIAFELLTGDTPMFGDSITDHISDAPELLLKLVHDCLSKRQDRRLKNGSELVGIIDMLSGPAVVQNTLIAAPMSAVPNLDVSDATRPLLISRISFPDLQEGAVVEAAGNILETSECYAREIPVGQNHEVSLRVTWGAVELLNKAIILRAGDDIEIETPKAFSISCDVPTWCTVKDNEGTVVTFPLVGLISPGKSSLSLSLHYEGRQIDTLETPLIPNESVLPLPFELVVLRIANVPKSTDVLINGRTVTKWFKIPVRFGSQEVVSLDIIEKKTGRIRHSGYETVRVGEPKVLDITNMLANQSSVDVSTYMNRLSYYRRNVVPKQSLTKTAVLSSVFVIDFFIAKTFYVQAYKTYCYNLVSDFQTLTIYKDLAADLESLRWYEFAWLRSPARDDPYFTNHLIKLNLTNVSGFLVTVAIGLVTIALALNDIRKSRL
jgi:serine/threonine protein kinase